MFEEINETQKEIVRWLDKLDEVSISYEARWGIGNLHQLVSADMADKIRRQDEKLTTAISAQDIRSVKDLVQGYIRGWEAMEADATRLGHKPTTPEYMEIKLPSGFHLRIAANNTEARAITEKGVYVWSLAEVARVIESDYTLVNQVKAAFPGASVSNIQAFDFDKGDDFPF